MWNLKADISEGMCTALEDGIACVHNHVGGFEDKGLVISAIKFHSSVVVNYEIDCSNHRLILCPPSHIICVLSNLLDFKSLTLITLYNPSQFHYIAGLTIGFVCISGAGWFVNWCEQLWSRISDILVSNSTHDKKQNKEATPWALLESR